MTCKNCGQELVNNTVTCPFCGTETGVTVSKKAKENSTVKSKKILIIVAVVLALAITVLAVSAAFTGFFGLMKGESSESTENSENSTENILPQVNGDIADLFNYVCNSLSKDNLTATVSIDPVKGIISDVEICADIKNNLMIGSYLEENGDDPITVDFGYETGFFYTCKDSEDSLPRGTAAPIENEFAKEFERTILNAIHSPSYESFTELACTFSGLLTAYEISDEMKEASAKYLVERLCDTQWLEQTAGFTVEHTDATKVYTFHPDAYELLSDYYGYLAENTEDGTVDKWLNNLEEDKEILDGTTYSLSVTVKDELVDSVDIVFTGVSRSMSSYSPIEEVVYTERHINAIVGDYNNTEVSLDELKNTLDEAHNGHTECVMCGKAAYFGCYCAECMEPAGYCRGFCGDFCDEDTSPYCEKCFKPCVECGEGYGDYNGYCHECYYDRYCIRDCGNIVTVTEPDSGFGYCDDCFEKCKYCDKNAKFGHNGFCVDCLTESFCHACLTEPATLRPSNGGYCEGCYVKCKECTNHADSRSLEGYCSSCVNEKFCRLCRKNPWTHSDSYGKYCDDCYVKCKECDNHASSRKEGYCHSCATKLFCAMCMENGISHQAENVGYCDECYTYCPECDNELRKLKDGVCYECYYNEHCHECGIEIDKNEKNHHKTCEKCGE